MSECAHDDVGGCKVCERALRAEVAALRERVQNRDDYIGPLADRIRDTERELAALREWKEWAIAHSRVLVARAQTAERELAEARALLAYVTERLAEWDETGDWADPKVTEARAFLRRDEARHCDECQPVIEGKHRPGCPVLRDKARRCALCGRPADMSHDDGTGAPLFCSADCAGYYGDGFRRDEDGQS